MITRRKFLKVGTLAGAGLLAPLKWKVPRVFAAISGGTQNPAAIPQYLMPLIIPPAMPRSGKIKVKGGKKIEYFEIAVRQFQQQILPAGMPMTTVWSYGSVNHPGSFNYPAFTIEAKWRKPVRVKWINNLKDSNGNFLSHLLPVDPTLHWANPPGGISDRDSRPAFTSTPGAYDGPVPMVTHLHGGHSTEESDGYAEAWYLPDAGNIPPDFATVGTWYDNFKAKFEAQWGQTWDPGTAVFQYDNDQRAATLWYHDHTLGMTRLNVYAGPAGFYILRGGPDDEVIGRLPGPAPSLGDPARTKYYEIPIAIQDRSFNSDGSLFYPDSRVFFDGYSGPYIPGTPVSPIWNPEFFGNTIVVNGRTWPFLEVEPRRYRFRLLNGCNSRFLILRFNNPNLSFWQIGTEGGFLPAPVQLSALLIGPAERADVIVDFAGFQPGDQIILENIGPDEPFGGGVPGADFPVADPATTGQVMQFRVVPLTARDRSTPPNQLVLPAITPLGAADNTRQVSLSEEEFVPPDEEGIPVAALLGTLDNGNPVPKLWMDPITENPALNSTEVWEIHNFTADAHPIHIHEVLFQVVDRQPFGGAARPPESWETGFKDTVIAYPDEITRVKAFYDRPGLFVWHCHIVEHEDNEMMRPYFIGPNPPMPKAQAGKEVAASTPNSYALHQNYPNPFNPDTEIPFQIPEATHVELKIFNSLGQEVETLINAHYPAGRHAAKWNAKNLASGVYHYRIQAGNFVAIKKMTLLR
jgi:bilirubin oxidase